MRSISVPTALLLPTFLATGLFWFTNAPAQEINLEEVFRCAGAQIDQDQCAEARDLIVNNCTSCHSFVPIVMQGFDEAGWTSLLDRHVGNGRVSQLSQEQIDLIHAYLTENFNGDLPPPELPPALLETWTSY